MGTCHFLCRHHHFPVWIMAAVYSITFLPSNYKQKSSIEKGWPNDQQHCDSQSPPEEQGWENKFVSKETLLDDLAGRCQTRPAMAASHCSAESPEAARPWAGCLGSPNLVLNTWSIPEELWPCVCVESWGAWVLMSVEDAAAATE